MRAITSLKTFAGGMNSLLHPSVLPESQFANAENVIVRGGIPQTRPGRRLMSSIQGSKIQGMCIFTPKNSTARILIAVDGEIRVARHPDYSFVKINGIQMDPLADKVIFQACIKSATSGLDGSVTITAPTPLVVIQDGVTQAAYWDGTTAKHLDPSPSKKGTPIGLWMSWSASRLWVADGSRVSVSDIADPLSFTENTYLAERSNFELPGDCTGMIETADRTGLLAFTEDSVTAFKSFIRERVKWQQTDEFQKVILPGLGCVAGRTLINHNGSTYWLSKQGIMSLDAALAGNRSSRMVSIDSEMDRHRAHVSSFAGDSCATAYDNFAIFALPVGGKRNERELILDTAPLESQGRSEVWSGVWSGVRPVAYGAGILGGKERLVFVSSDANTANDTAIHLWEGVRNRKLDEEGPIECQFETRMITSERNVRFIYAEVDLVGISGLVNFRAFVGGKGGPWYQVADIDLRADKGCIGSESQPLIERGVPLRSFRAQNRTIKTKEFNPAVSGSCNPEFGKDTSPGVDNAFAMLFEWSGIAGIREVRIVTDDATSGSTNGRCEDSEYDAPHVVLDTGGTI